MHALRAPLPDSPPLVRHGLPIYEFGTLPAAGANFTYTVDGNYFVRLLTLSVRLATDANAANRTVRLEYLDYAGNVFAVCGNPVTYPANTTAEDFFFSVWQGQGEWEVAASNLVPLAPLLLPPTFAFRVLVNNIQAGDTLTRIRFLREEFYTADQPRVYPPEG